MLDFIKVSKNISPYELAFEASIIKLTKKQPYEIVKDTDCTYDDEQNCFYLNSFSNEFAITFPEGEVRFRDERWYPQIGYRLLLLNYLSYAKDLPLTNKWITYREQPGGDVFFPNIQQYTLLPMGKFYDTCDKRRIEASLKELGFTCNHDKADLEAIGWFTPRIPVLVRFWEGEEDIQGACQIMFDLNISLQMHLEDSAALCDLVAKIITGHYKEIMI